MDWYQDGSRFYNEDGDMVFEASVAVSDFDVEAAQEARAEFLSKREPMGPHYVTPACIEEWKNRIKR